MNILGISAYQFDPAVSLIKDGKVILCLEEEKISQHKRIKGFPYLALEELLKQTKIDLNDIDAIVFNHSPKQVISLEYLKWFPNFSLMKACLNRSLYFSKLFIMLYKDLKRYFLGDFYSLFRKIKFVPHHIAHAASTYFVSPFKKSSILTLDGGGESVTGMLAVAEDNEIIPIEYLIYPISLGKFYSAITSFLGFVPNRDEGKVMGLSAYGTEELVNSFVDIINFNEKTKKIEIDLKYFSFYKGKNKYVSQYFIEKFGLPRKNNEKITKRDMNLAFAAQERLEQIVLQLVKRLKDKTNLDNICLAGGIFLNCALNNKIEKSKIFKNVHIQPAVNDAGTSFGAALYYFFKKNTREKINFWFSPYLGISYDKKQIKKELDNFSSILKYEYIPNDIEKKTASYLAEGKIVAWFQGRGEIGPRALGNRSILSHPQGEKRKDYINFFIKEREWFRPLAPVVLDKFKKQYFIGEDNSVSQYYMLSIDYARKDTRERISACIHCDGSSRLQVVSAEKNKKLYRLIYEFYKITGIPVLLNTSFNIKGMPIVYNVTNAIESFLFSKIDILVIDSFIITKYASKKN